MLRTILLSIFIGWMGTTGTACAGPTAEHWHSISEGSPFTWKETPAVNAKGEVETRARISGSGTQSKVYPALRFIGTADLPPKTRIYAFFTQDGADSASVVGFLSETDPESWKSKRDDPKWREILKPNDNFLEVEVGEKGSVFFVLDGLRSPNCTSLRMLTLVDKDGKVLDRLKAGG